MLSQAERERAWGQIEIELKDGEATLLRKPQPKDSTPTREEPMTNPTGGKHRVTLRDKATGNHAIDSYAYSQMPHLYLRARQ
jgi:hypothetical protein